VRLWISVLAWSYVLSILCPIFLSSAFKLNCANFEDISVDLTTSPKSKFSWTISGLLPQMLTWVSIEWVGSTPGQARRRPQTWKEAKQRLAESGWLHGV